MLHTSPGTYVRGSSVGEDGNGARGLVVAVSAIIPAKLTLNPAAPS